MNQDTTRLPEEEESVQEIMTVFNCPLDIAKTIMQSSKMNGQLSNIKKMCHDQRIRRENRNA